MILQENLKSYQEKVIQKSLDAMNQLYTLAKQLDKKEAASNFQNLIEKLKSDKFNLVIVGRFNNGKSTFANALLGQPTSGRILNGDKGPLPTARVECTAVLTYVRHAERPSVKALHMNRKTEEEWSFDKYLVDGRVQTGDSNNEAFKNIKAFVVGFPSPLLKEGLVLVDTPGTDDVPERTRIAREAVGNADAAIVVYSSNQPGGEAERAFVENQLTGTVSKVYTVINMFFEADDEFLRSVWHRLVADKIKRPYNPATFHEYGIYFVDALQAFKGKVANDSTAQRKSGLSDFEESVSNFLTRERGKTHLLSSVFPAANSAKELTNEIGRQIAILKADEEKFRQVLDKLRPRLAELKRRPEEVKRVFGHYEEQLKARLRTEYDLLLLKLPQDVADYMLSVELSSLQNYQDVLFKQKQCVDEAKTAAERFIKEQMSSWNEQVASPIVAKAMDAMSSEIEEVFGRIKADTRFIEFQLNSTLSGGENISMVSQWDKIMGVAYGIIMQDYVHLATGGAFGWRGLVTAFASRFVIFLGALAVGATGGVAALVAVVGGAIASFFIGKETAGKNLRKRMGQSFGNAINQDRPKMLIELEQKISEKFTEFSAPILELIQKQINQDIEGIEQMAHDNERGQAEKTTRIKQLERAKDDVLAQQKILSEIHLNV